MSEQPETAAPRDDEPATAAPPESSRASRQSLVVKPRRSNGPLLVLGSIASAAAGFAIVFVSGLGRSDPTVGVPEAPVLAASEPSRPRFFSPADDDRDRPDAIEASPIDHRAESRFPATTVALEDPAGNDEPPEDSTSGSSAFSSSAFSSTAADAGSSDAADQAVPLFVPPDEGPHGEPAAAAPRFADPPADATQPPPTQPPPMPPEPKDDAPSPIAVASNSAAPDPDDANPDNAIPADANLAAALTPVQPPASKPSASLAASPLEDPEAPIPVTPPGGGPAADGRGGRDSARSDVPRPDRIASTDVTRGFGGAPVVTPPPSGPPPAPSRPPSGDGVAGSPSVAAGAAPVSADGRPGPIQLEGIQTPQLTIEKRGPREVQVGKVARYDMVVRNVGGVSAHDVTLRDRVPLGTKLVTTSPPAAPGEAGELVWALGSLPQGGQARVAMEVMPVDEGEVGSVASVSFRADASVRSVATRAGLAIDAENPKAVLVGSTVDLAIIVRNPGTGEATGVVLEGSVPAGFTHASGSALEYDVGRLRPGETRRIDLKLVSTHPGVQALKLSARADGRIETDHAVRLEVTAPTLELTTNMPNRRYLQRPVTCVLSINNAGTAPANTIELAAQLPPGMKFLRANNSGYYEESTHRVLWHLEQLPAAEVGSVEMVLVPTALGPQRIAAAARSADGLAAQAAHTVEVEGLAALLFEVGDSEDPIEVDGITEYVVRVGNQGTKAATGVRVTATLLGDLEPVDAKGPVPHRVENLTVLFEPLANLAPAQESVYRIRARGRRDGDQRVQVQVTSDDSQSPITKEEVTRVYADR